MHKFDQHKLSWAIWAFASLVKLILLLEVSIRSWVYKYQETSGPIISVSRLVQLGQAQMNPFKKCKLLLTQIKEVKAELMQRNVGMDLRRSSLF